MRWSYLSCCELGRQYNLGTTVQPFQTSKTLNLGASENGKFPGFEGHKSRLLDSVAFSLEFFGQIILKGRLMLSAGRNQSQTED